MTLDPSASHSLNASGQRVRCFQPPLEPSASQLLRLMVTHTLGRKASVRDSDVTLHLTPSQEFSSISK